MAEIPKCRLCMDSNVPPAEADLFATVPMCGKRPRYPLCLPCYEDIAEECEDVTLVEDVSESGRPS
jgi:hypothetical protein